MGEVATRSWVWKSTPASRAASQTSLLALLETTLCVIAYWALWKWWGLTWHHWLIVLATPLVLLRSERSVALAAKWFDDLVKDSTEDSLRARKSDCHKIAMMAFVAFSVPVFSKSWSQPDAGVKMTLALTSIYLSFRIYRKLTAEGDDFNRKDQNIFLLMLFVTILLGSTLKQALDNDPTVIAIVLACVPAVFFRVFSTFLTDAYMHKSIQISVAYGMILVPGLSLGIAARAMLLRASSVAVHITQGLQTFPKNWAETISAVDSFVPAELVPESKFGTFDHLIWEKSSGDQEPGVTLGFALARRVAALIALAPTIVWRWSIKSTAWFYLPLAFVVRNGMAETDSARASFARAYSRKQLSILFLLLALVSLTSALTAMVRPDWLVEMTQKATDAGAPVPVVGYLLVLDWSRIAEQPWQWVYLPSALLSVVLFFLYDNIGRNIDHGIDEARYYPLLRQMQRIGNLSLVLTLTGLLVALWHFTLAIGPWS